MRKIDETKRAAITNAVFQITYDEGITNLSISKIARMVGVSKATMYVYYADKTDMLSKIFLEVKTLMDDGLSQTLKRDLPFDQRVKLSLDHFADKFSEYPYEANFMRAINDNPSLVKDGVIEQSMLMVQPLMDLFNEGVAQKHWVTDDMEILVAMMFSPIENLTETYFKKGQDVPQQKLIQMIDIIVSSVVE